MKSRMPLLTRYAGIYAALIRYSLIHEMQFKVNFLLWIVVEALWFGLQLAFMTVLYGHTDQIAGWSRWEVVLLVGCNQFIQQLFHMLFVTNLSNLSELIRKGTLDLLLLQPVNTRFLISVKKFEIGNIANALMGLAVVFYALAQLGRTPSPAQWLGFVVVCVAGLSVHYSLMFLLACISFWTVRAQGIVWGYYNLFNIARLPAKRSPGALTARSSPGCCPCCWSPTFRPSCWRNGWLRRGNGPPCCSWPRLVSLRANSSGAFPSAITPAPAHRVQPTVDCRAPAGTLAKR